VALVRGADGARLAKRHGSPTVAERRARGHSPQSVVGLLATSLGLIPAGNSSNPQDLLPLWDPSRLSQDDTVLKEAAGG
jgi:glutamyl-tRNA synthetase